MRLVKLHQEHLAIFDLKPHIYSQGWSELVPGAPQASHNHSRGKAIVIPIVMTQPYFHLVTRALIINDFHLPR